jgi:hypothetical protein
MAAKKLTPARITNHLVSDDTFRLPYHIRDLRFDASGILMGTNSQGSWARWDVERWAVVDKLVAPQVGMPPSYKHNLQRLDVDTLIGRAAAYTHAPARIDAATGQVLGPIEMQPDQWPAHHETETHTFFATAQGLAVVLRDQLRVLDPRTLEERAAWKLPMSVTVSVPASSANRLLLCSGPSMSFCVDLRTGEIEELPPASKWVKPLAVSDEAALITHGDELGAAALLYVPRGGQPVTLVGRGPRINAGALTPDGSGVLVVDAEGMLRRYALDGAMGWETQLTLIPEAIACHPSAPLLAVSVGCRVELLDAATGARKGCAGAPGPLGVLSFGSDPLTACLAPGANASGTLYPEGTLSSSYVWSLGGAAPARATELGAQAVLVGGHAALLREQISVQPIADLLDRVHPTEPMRGARPLALRADGSAAYAVTQGKNGKKVEYALERQTLVDGVWQRAAVLERGTKPPALGITIHEQAGVLAAHASGPLHVYDLATDQQLHILGGMKSGVTSAVWSPDGQYVAAVNNKLGMCWRVGDEVALWVHKDKEELRAVVFTPDGASVIISPKPLYSGVRARLYVLDTLTGQRQAELEVSWAGEVSALGFGPDGHLYAVGNTNLYRVDLP